MERVDNIIGLIDAVLPPEATRDALLVAEMIEPQFEFIVALSGIERVFESRGGDKDFYDTHHLFWPKADYRTELEKTFRKQFVIPINRGIHDELHNRIAPPAKPNRDVMLGFLATLDIKNRR